MGFKCLCVCLSSQFPFYRFGDEKKALQFYYNLEFIVLFRGSRCLPASEIRREMKSIELMCVARVCARASNVKFSGRFTNWFNVFVV